MSASRTDPRTTVLAAGAAFALAVCGTVSLAVGDVLGFLSPGAEAAFTLTWITGWMLLAWSAIVVGVATVQLLRAAGHRRPGVVDVLLAVGTIAVLAGAVATHPLAGSGAGVG